MRRPIIAGNWKMNMTPSEARALVEELKPLVKDAKCEVVVCPPYVDLSAVSELIKDSNIRLGAQNIHWAEKGAFTGEVSANMLKELGVEYAICVGESLEERERGRTEAKVSGQVKKDLEGIAAGDVAKLVIAYEPIWAIGTGKTATDEQANETIGMIRATVAGMFGKETAEALRIQYGGSMKPSNARSLMAMPEIDGGLIGGASLKAVDFSQVVNYND